VTGLSIVLLWAEVGADAAGLERGGQRHMAQVIGKLAALQIAKLAKRPELHNDGGNLYLLSAGSQVGIITLSPPQSVSASFIAPRRRSRGPPLAPE